MPRRSRAQRKTLQPGIQKHKIRSKKEDGGGVFHLLEQCVPKGCLHRFFSFAENCFTWYTKVNCKLCLVPYSVSKDGKLEKLSTNKLWIHYSLLSILVISMLHKFVIFMSRIASGQLDTKTFICAATFLCYLVAFSISSSCLIRTDETMDMINGWPTILMYYSEEVNRVPLIGNTKTAVVISSLAVLAMTIAVAASAFSIVFRALPVTFLVAAEAAGFIPANPQIPRIFLKLLFWPLEFIMYVLPMFLAGWGAMVMMLLVMVVMSCANQLRKVSVLPTQEDRVQLWHKYNTLQVFNEVSRSWAKLMIVPTISSATSTIIICFYVTIRHQEVPVWLVPLFFYVGVTLFGIVFWIAYQVILVIRSSEAIIGVLTSVDEENYGGVSVPLALRKYIVKKGKATRPLNYRIGEFNEFSLDVPMGIWDEILNQLLFLLSF